MQKPKLSTLELVFVLAAASTLFIVTFYQMSTAGILPGNDPAVHLVKSATIVINQRVTYSAVPWYPPLFHTVVAILQIFAGTLDVMAAAFLLKLLISTFSVLILLSTYLLCRKLFGIGVAIVAGLFTVMSLPNIEMVFWGGYANFMGLAYIALIFYIITKEMKDITKMFLLFGVAFTIVMSHQLATFVFVLLFIPIFIINSLSGSKRKTLVYLAVVIGGGVAILAWYAQIIIEYSNMIIEHLFYAMTENIYTVSEVGLDALIRNNFGATLALALAGIPVTIILLKQNKNLKASILLLAWLTIPFILAESHLFGFYLPYTRFIYFFATPIAILAGVFTYNLTKIPIIVETKLAHKIKNKQNIIVATKVLAIALIASLLVAQAVFFVERTETYPEYYERASTQSYYTGLWIQEHASSEGTVVTSRSPGSWMNILSDHHTSEETNPLYSRNTAAESIIYSFYELENSESLIREYAKASPDAGQDAYVQVYNIWKKVVSVPNQYVNFIYVDPYGRWINIPLNETETTVYWGTITENEAQLITEYNHELFTVTKVATVFSNTSVINVTWEIQTYKSLANVKLAFTNYMEPSFNFQEVLAPGLLEWQNPWENSTYENENGHWAVIETSFANLTGNTIAYLDTENQILSVFEFNESPDWLIMGALENRLVDLLRVRYELGYINIGQKKQISYSIFVCTSDFDNIKQYNASELIEVYDQTEGLELQQRDYFTYVEEYDVTFVVIDNEQVVSNKEASPDFDRIYDNGRITAYTTKR